MIFPQSERRIPSSFSYVFVEKYPKYSIEKMSMRAHFRVQFATKMVYPSCVGDTMKYLATRDFFSIRRASLVSDLDRRLVATLYQPLVGHQGLALYLTLDSLHDEGGISPLPHEALLTHMQISINDLSLAKAQLEAVGLLKTFIRKKTDYSEYLYTLYAPKSPAEFFDDVIFAGLFRQTVGEAAAQGWHLRYAAPATLAGYDEETASFAEVFHPDFTNPLFNRRGPANLLGRRTGMATTSFDRRAFIDQATRIGGLKPDFFTETAVDEIDRLANLFGIDELAMAELITQALDSDAKYGIDLDKLQYLASIETRLPYSKSRRRTNVKVTSHSAKAEKINLMETTDPKNYFRYRNLNNQPALNDLKIISDIESRSGLPHPVINALIDYVLEIANLTFPRTLVEKVASSLVRAQVTSAVDAMEYLLSATRKRKGKPSAKPAAEPAREGEKPLQETIDVDALIAAFERDKEGK